MSDLRGMKPGDEIFIGQPWGPGRIVKVERVTPSGRVIAGGDTYMPRGSMVGGRSWAQPVEQHHRDHIERWELEHKAKQLADMIQLHRESTDFLRRFVQAIEPFVNEQESRRQS